MIASLLALAAQLVPMSGPAGVVQADALPVPKAVFIVGPASGLTDSVLAESEEMAQQAEAVGMDVRRVFFPHATWDNVLANIQGANLVVYMGHGYGWPSPYTKVLTESRQNGMGLNSYDGSGKNEHTYYGANLIRANIVLAPNAVVILNHLCYAAGNGEPGTAIPSVDIARQRVDNMANGWLAAGARAVFAYSWGQNLNYPQALMTTDATVDGLFMTPGGGSPAGYIGWQDSRFASERTPGAVNHLDPHPSYGYYRAVTGDLNMTAAEWRSGAAPGNDPPPSDSGAAPQITALSASVASPSVTAADPPTFHPNGDGLDEELLLRHAVTRAAYLDATVTDDHGTAVRSYSVWSATGTSTSRWDGRDDQGRIVPDGRYTLTYVPRDTANAVGAPVSVQTLVLTAAALGRPSRAAIFAADGDTLAARTRLTVTVNQQARVSWQVVDAAGAVVRTVRSSDSVAAGTLRFSWDGRADDGAWVPDGWYSSIVSVTTSLGSYSQERRVYVGAFRVTPSTSFPVRGGRLTLTVSSTEPLATSPTFEFTEPGVDPWSVTASRVSGNTYRVTVDLPATGQAGTLGILISGTDKAGGRNQGWTSLPLR